MTQPLLDRPEVSQVLFYPRRAYGLASAPGGARSIGVEVEPGIVLGGRLYPAAPDSPAILFFHGNGEIAEDQDDIAPMYTQVGITLLVMDYRGYGTSDGAPAPPKGVLGTASHLLSDAVVVFEAMGRVLNDNAADMGKVYLACDLGQVPAFAGQGPEATDPALTLNIFRERLRPYRGEVKGVLTDQSFVAGIGHAYADEILQSAHIYPFRRRSDLDGEDIAQLYVAMRSVLSEAIVMLRERVGENIDVEVHDFVGAWQAGSAVSALRQFHQRGKAPAQGDSFLSHLPARLDD